METNFNCGFRIRQLRNERGISQEQLALSAGITPAYLGLVERGQRNATVKTIERICGALGIGLAEFFAETNKQMDMDDVDKMLMYYVRGLDYEEKQVCLQLIKTALQLRISNAQTVDIA